MMTDSSLRYSPRIGVAILLILLCAGVTTTAVGRPHPDLRDVYPDRIDGIHVLDGSYVMSVGSLRVNITNHGLIGSQFTDFLPFSSAPSAQWPGGSGDEYLYGAGIWIGARVAGEPSVTTGQPERELRPEADITATIYEAKRGRILRPTYSDYITGRRLPELHFDDDGDDQYDEDGLNGVDDDGDGLIDEDFGQLGDQMMVATMHDDTPLVQEIYPSHQPLGVTVVQRSIAWADPDFDDFVGLDFEIHNNSHRVIEDLYVGFYADCDIQRRDQSHTDPDDLAGFYDGVARGPDGRYHRIQVAWMRDGATEDPLPGVIGVMLLDHTTDFSGLRAPPGLGVTGFQSFTMNESYNQGGEPLSDADRYDALSRDRFDRDTHANEGEDYKILITTGPFRYVMRGAVIRYRVALVMGTGLDGMLRNALQASIAQRGEWFDADENFFTGLDGRETVVCFGDLPSVYGVRPLETYWADFMDQRCVGPGPFFGYSTIEHDDNIFVDDDGRRCLYVNADNCEICFQQTGAECQPSQHLNPGDLQSSTYAKSGHGGREHRAAWLLTGALPPVPPAMRVVPRENRVEIYWDNRSEYDRDPRTRVYDFESYRVWRVTDWTRPVGVDELQIPPADMWDLIVERDRVNYVPAGVGMAGHETPLGRNTGLSDLLYRPVCLDDPVFEGVADIMKTIVAADPTGSLVRLPRLRRLDGTPRQGFEALLPWEDQTAVLDTFFAVTSRLANADDGVVGKRSTRYYSYVDEDLHNNFATYYAVTARDHALARSGQRWVPSGYGVEAAPGQNFLLTRPRQAAQTAANRSSNGVNIFVYPNPVTRESLAEFDLQATTWDNPTGAQIVWANLPAARNTIRIYTASGDLVQTLQHDGSLGDGTAAWNLVSRNRQEVSSGIYLYVVQSDDDRFEDFVGRFVVVW